MTQMLAGTQISVHLSYPAHVNLEGDCAPRALLNILHDK